MLYTFDFGFVVQFIFRLVNADQQQRLYTYHKIRWIRRPSIPLAKHDTTMKFAAKCEKARKLSMNEDEAVEDGIQWTSSKYVSKWMLHDVLPEFILASFASILEISYAQTLVKSQHIAAQFIQHIRNSCHTKFYIQPEKSVVARNASKRNCIWVFVIVVVVVGWLWKCQQLSHISTLLLLNLAHHFTRNGKYPCTEGVDL